ncbi:exodeoxyribonuclease V subunit alpha [Colwellia echini]|uniref:RecBCD enzyme subunit RecD n=2 Tax=Colwellia echini TaxID=1982103 RepID=A0ABY3MU32_9GAMM|nr:exodeoxyribonuclease V subunit alpha [Colwellia echini]
MDKVMAGNSIYNNFQQAKAAILGIEAIDYFFAKEMINALTESLNSVTVANNVEEKSLLRDENVYHMFLALSVSLRAGHSCLPLAEIGGKHWGKGFASKASQELTEQELFQQEKSDLSDMSESSAQTLSHVGFVFAPLSQLQQWLSELNLQIADKQLVVLDNDNLYMRRYFQFEYELGRAIKSRLNTPCTYSNDDIRASITSIFPEDAVQESEKDEVDWQKIAVANAINKNFSVIAGGPGTGKTYTVTKLLAALVSLARISPTKQNQENDNENDNKALSDINIVLVAPTGKAAQRLSESIVDAISGFAGLIDANVLADIPTQAQTIHRLLGVIPNSPNFRHDENNRLAYDIVLIDEVSMVDLPLMTRVFRALKDSCKVILLGDADQLPSVAAGSVLADIAPRPHGGFSTVNQEYLLDVCNLNLAQQQGINLNSAIKHTPNNSPQCDYLTFLIKSRRFDGKGGIGLIANAVINGDVNRSWQLLNDTKNTDTESAVENQLVLAQDELTHWLAPLVKQYYQPIAQCSNVKDAFTLLSQFRVLCATRQGDYGVEQLNEQIKGYLGKSTPFHLQTQQGQQSHNMLYHGLPIMINQNDYRLGLYNGDIGIIWHVEDKNGNKHLMACFEESSAVDGIRKILPSRLPQFESVYAMTIHKTQGSEFTHVAMVLSANDNASDESKIPSGSKLLSRELLYTGITRAKKKLTIATNKTVWKQGVIGQVKRYSGLSLDCSS